MTRGHTRFRAFLESSEAQDLTKTSGMSNLSHKKQLLQHVTEIEYTGSWTTAI